jgi:hypothetical protein
MVVVAALQGALILSGCGGDNKGSMTEVPDPKSMSEKEGEVSDEEVAEVIADGPAFDAEFGKRVLERGTRKAQECAAMGAPTGEGEVTVVFDGEKGRVTDVELGYPYADASDQAQKCIKNAFMGEMIPPFEGTHKEPHTFEISEKKDEKKK